jgi:methylenetetrahydrofolate dehydrogenase (NADP+) / methenyltetrahydrofolate cyclohydrolase
MSKKVSGNIFAERISDEVLLYLSRVGGCAPTLAVVICSDDPAVLSYSRSKQGRAQKLGVNYKEIVLPISVTQEQLESEIQILSMDRGVHGIMIELPLGKHLNPESALNAIAQWKDVDGLNSANTALIAANNEEDSILPATPQACIEIAESFGSLSGKRVAVIGRGKTVGRPLALMLVNRGATVTVCHSRTPSIKDAIKDAEIIFSAAGKPGLLSADMVESHHVVIDAGLHFSDGKLQGDLADNAHNVVTAFTPSKGGVGPVTTAMLFRNLIRCHQKCVFPQTVLDSSLDAFIKATASHQPTPGGGSVSFVSGLMGVSLISMAIEVSLRAKNVTSAPELGLLQSQVGQIINELEGFPDKDISCFVNYMDVLKLPKETEEQKEKRKLLLDEAALQASTIPLDGSKKLLQGLDVARKAAGLVRQTIVSDVMAGSILIVAAIEAALLNVSANVGDNASLTAEVNDLLSEATTILVTIRHLVNSR